MFTMVEGEELMFTMVTILVYLNTNTQQIEISPDDDTK